MFSYSPPHATTILHNKVLGSVDTKKVNARALVTPKLNNKHIANTFYVRFYLAAPVARSLTIEAKLSDTIDDTFFTHLTRIQGELD